MQSCRGLGVIPILQNLPFVSKWMPCWQHSLTISFAKAMLARVQFPWPWSFILPYAVLMELEDGF